MRTAHEILFTSALAFVCATSSGCSLIGYAIGGAADTDKYVVDSVAFCHSAKGLPEESAQPADSAKFENLMKKAGPGQEALVTVVTTKEMIVGAWVAADTDFALRSEGSNREGLLPGEPVSVILNDSNQTHVKGRVQRLKAEYIVLGGVGVARAYPFSALKAIVLNDESVISPKDLSSPQSSGRFVRIPVLALGPSVTGPSVPLREVLELRVTQKATSVTGRLVGFGLGLGLDVLAVRALLQSIVVLPSFGSIPLR
ncbi:MAG TPA: hypothetical protein VL126_12040 [Bacteroidota bacterium]|nr:hypothetical protein [Bacteroidota bacterium]